MSDVNLLDQVLTANDAAKPRPATPAGPYRAVLRAAKDGQNPSNGNRLFELTFGLLEATGDQDMEDVDLSRAQAYMTVWVTEGTVTSGILQRILTELGSFEEGNTPRQIIENSIGNEVEIVVAHRASDLEQNPPRKYPRLDVVKLGDFDNNMRKMKAAA